MKKIYSVFVILFLGMALTACSSNSGGNTGGSSSAVTSSETSSQMAKTHDVLIENNAFKPETVTVKRGDIVVWTNEDTTVHNIKATDFQSPDLKKGEKYEHVFEKAGTYDYSCGIHPQMKGQIKVLER